MGEERRWEERVWEERGRYSRIGYQGRGNERSGWDAMIEEWKGRD